jgi:hypothetical protein
MRSPIKATITGAPGVSPWLPVDYVQTNFNLGLFASLSEDASAAATYSVEYTPDNPNQGKTTRNNLLSLIRVAAVATIVFANPHGLLANDAVKVFNSGDPNLDGDQTVVSTPTPTSLTYAVGNTGALIGTPYTEAIALRVFPLQAALTAATTRQSASLTTPCMAVRLHVTALTAGSITLEVVQGLARA